MNLVDRVAPVDWFPFTRLSRLRLDSKEFIVIERGNTIFIQIKRARAPAALLIRIINRARKRALIEGKLYGRD